MPMTVDSHAHLTDPKLLPHIDQILANAKHAGVEKVITIGTTLQDSENALKLCDLYKNVFAGIGVYPDEMLETDLHTIETKLDLLLAHKKVVGVGETGIDVFVPKDSPQTLEEILKTIDLTRQIALFEIHIKLAIKHKLPIIIHNRNADKICYDILAKYQNTGLIGVFHCFTSSWEFAQKVLDLGFYISFSGIITYSTGAPILETVKNIPHDRFLIETDAPYLAPLPHRGKPNKPEYVKMTMDKIAEVKQIPLSIACDNAYLNTTRLFFSKGNVKQ